MGAQALIIAYTVEVLAQCTCKIILQNPLEIKCLNCIILNFLSVAFPNTQGTPCWMKVTSHTALVRARSPDSATGWLSTAAVPAAGLSPELTAAASAQLHHPLLFLFVNYNLKIPSGQASTAD